MKIHIGIAALIAIFVIPSAHAEHKHGPRNECWRDTKYPGNGWAYYYCGAQKNKCDGKKSKGHDTVFWQYHGDFFEFETEQKERYWCCGGTKEAEGKYVRADEWSESIGTETKQLANGTCNKSIEKTVCGDEIVKDCFTPDNCDSGYIQRNGTCVKLCGENEVFESQASNTCIKCETTPYQGVYTENFTITDAAGTPHPVAEQRCKKCDKDSEFFNKATKSCVKKSTLKAYSIPDMKSCWRCPQSYRQHCIEAMRQAAQMGVSGAALAAQVDSLGALQNIPNLAKQCHIGE